VGSDGGTRILLGASFVSAVLIGQREDSLLVTFTLRLNSMLAMPDLNLPVAAIAFVFGGFLSKRRWKQETHSCSAS
jgi:hypothetical protein